MKCEKCPYCHSIFDIFYRKTLPLFCNLPPIENNFYKGNYTCLLTEEEKSKIAKLYRETKSLDESIAIAKEKELEEYIDELKRKGK